MIENYMEVLDKRICDVKSDANNTETYREFINNSCDEFNISRPQLNTHEDVLQWIEFLDELWCK